MLMSGCLEGAINVFTFPPTREFGGLAFDLVREREWIIVATGELFEPIEPWCNDGTMIVERDAFLEIS
jgi:hypothetical protein